MKGFFKKFATVFFAAVITCSGFAASACRRDTYDPPAGLDTSIHVNLKYVFMTAGGSMADSSAVFEKVNEIVKEKINATITFESYSSSDYGAKLNLMLSTKEKVDMFFIQPSTAPLNYQGAVAKKYLKDITELLPICAPDIYASMDASIWEAAKVNGKIYGVINEQIMARAAGVNVQSDFIDDGAYARGVKSSDITKYEDLTLVMDNIMEYLGNNGGLTNGYPPINTWLAAYSLWQYGYMQEEGYDDLTGGVLLPGVVKADDTTATVINQFDTQAYRDYIAFSRSMIDKKYTNPDDFKPNAVRDSTQQRIRLGGTYKPGAEITIKTEVLNKWDFKQLMFGTPTLTTSSVSSTLFAVNALSQNAERALMFQNLLYTDKELYNLLCLGLEGRDWNWNADKTAVEIVATSKYRPNADWVLGAEVNAYPRVGQVDDVSEQTKSINSNGRKSVAFGFVFNPDPVATEITNCRAYVDTFNTAFAEGRYTADKLEEELQKALTELNNRGAQKIIEEKQKQLNAYLGKS